MPTLKFPENCSSASIGDFELVPDEKGCAVIPIGIDYSELLNHGFTPATESDLLPIKQKALAEKQKKEKAFADGEEAKISASDASQGKAWA